MDLRNQDLRNLLDHTRVIDVRECNVDDDGGGYSKGLDLPSPYVSSPLHSETGLPEVNYPYKKSQKQSDYPEKAEELCWLTERPITDKRAMKPTLNRVKMTLPSHLGDIKTQIIPSVIALYDTGASINAIDRDFALKHYKNKIIHRASPLHTSTAGGQIKLREYVSDTILHRNRIVETRFYLIPDLGHKLVLGRNTCRHLGYIFFHIDSI